MDYLPEKTNQKPIFYIIAMMLVLLSLMFFVLSGHSLDYRIATVSLLAIIGLVCCYYNTAAVFLAIIFILPVIIGADRYQINAGFFLPNTFSTSGFFINPFSLLCFFLIFLAGIEFFRKKFSFFQMPLSIILPIVALISLLSFTQLENKFSGIVYELYLLAGFAAYFLGYHLLGNKKKYLCTLLIIVFSSAIPVIYAFYQVVIGDFMFENDSNLPRIDSTFPHPNTFGSFLFVVLAVSLILFFAIKLINHHRSVQYRLFQALSLLPFAFIFPLFILTYSRTAWFGFFFSALIAAFFRPALRFPAIYGGALAAFAMVLFEKTRERIVGIFEHHMFDSMYGRQEIWDMAIYAALKKPFLGYGMGSFGEVIQTTQGKETGNIYPHNDSIRFFVEAGIVGFLGFVLYMVGAIYYALKSFLKYGDRKETVKIFGYEFTVDYKFLGLIPFCLFASMAVISFVEAPSMDFVYQILAWTILGSWLGLNEKLRSKN